MKKSSCFIIRIIFLTVLSFVSLAGLAADSVESTLNQMVEHLGFLGYSVEDQGDNVFYATGQTHQPDFWLEELDGFIWFSTYWTPENSLSEKGALRALNDLNSLAYIARYSMDEDGDIWIEATAVPHYERELFVSFMDMWEFEALSDFFDSPFMN